MVSETTQHGNNIVRGFTTRNHYINATVGMCRLYDNGYTAAYYTDTLLFTYCEGDTAQITGDNLEAERAAHLTYYIENEG